MKTFRLGGGRILFRLDKAGTANAVRQLAGRCHTNIINQLQQPKSGKRYKRGRKMHTASAPGEPPAVDTGLMIANLVQRRHARGEIVGILEKPDKVPAAYKSANPGKKRVRIKYPAGLEKGTPKVKPRPFLRPAIQAALRGRILPRNLITTFK